MVLLVCPLCCNETFTSHLLLKSHLIDVIEKSTICPSCTKQFENISNLIAHLENDCTIREEITIVNEQLINNNESILEKVLLTVGTENKNSIDVIAETKAIMEINNSSNDEEYFCQMCDLHFNNIEEHLEKYHEGQEIILETGDAEQILPANSSDFTLDPDNIFIINPIEDNTNKVLNPSSKKINSINKLDTITEENLRDKEGRLYTRKLVKIDKFWLNNSKTIKEPVVQKYLLENGKVKKITSEEADNIENKDTIIEIYECPNCNLLFPLIENFKQHECPSPIQTELTLLKCNDCNISFMDTNSLKVHMKTHHLKKLTMDPINDHNQLLDEDESRRAFNCDICNTAFPTSKSLRLHRRMHEPMKNSKEIYAPVKNLVAESNSEDNQEREMFVCKICHKSYDKQHELIHMKSHSNESSFICEICNRKFFTKSNLDMHMKAHSNNKKFACSYCKKTFVTYDSLKEHVQIQCQQRSYACRFCGRRFIRPHEKVKHERIHTGEKPHVCEICGKSFRISYCLTLHMRTHSGTRPYQCQYCSKRFKSHSVYNHHLLTHSDVRAYKCPYCPKAFKTSVQLAGHKNSHIKPFACTECNRPFSSLYTVRAHMETHKRDNNLKYECCICGALYSRAFALKDHLKEQHQQQISDDERESSNKAFILNVEEDINATDSILVKNDDIIIGFGDTDCINNHVEIINNVI